jgi:GDPmannose 4,6-dehydratase
MLRRRAGARHVIATGRTATLQDFVASAFAAAGLDWASHVAIDPALRRPTDLQGFGGDAAKAAGELGWSPRTAMPDVAAAMVRAELGGA